MLCRVFEMTAAIITLLRNEVYFRASGVCHIDRREIFLGALRGRSLTCFYDQTRLFEMTGAEGTAKLFY